jgi:hypothetical protein
MIEFLERLTLPEKFHDWALARLERARKQKINFEDTQRFAAEKSISDVERQLENLTKLRVRDMITDVEYLKERQELELLRARLLQNRGRLVENGEWFEPAKLAISFSSRAVSCFKAGDAQLKRLILEIAGSNLTLDSKILRIEARKPFRWVEGTNKNLTLCGFVEDVRTFFGQNTAENDKIIAKLQQFAELTSPQLNTV